MPLNPSATWIHLMEAPMAAPVQADFRIMVLEASNVPKEYRSLVVSWKKGAKCVSTSPAAVHRNRAEWNEAIKVTTALCRVGQQVQFQAKFCWLQVASEDGTVVLHDKVNLAECCDGQVRDRTLQTHWKAWAQFWRLRAQGQSPGFFWSVTMLQPLPGGTAPAAAAGATLPGAAAALPGQPTVPTIPGAAGVAQIHAAAQAQAQALALAQAQALQAQVAQAQMLAQAQVIAAAQQQAQASAQVKLALEKKAQARKADERRQAEAKAQADAVARAQALAQEQGITVPPEEPPIPETAAASAPPPEPAIPEPEAPPPEPAAPEPAPPEPEAILREWSLGKLPASHVARGEEGSKREG
eukprot:symbB.v1.2.009819.t1/scaffold627.1/size179893/11